MERAPTSPSPPRSVEPERPPSPLLQRPASSPSRTKAAFFALGSILAIGIAARLLAGLMDGELSGAWSWILFVLILNLSVVSGRLAWIRAFGRPSGFRG